MLEEDYIKVIGTNIKTRRIALGLTQVALADSVGIEDSALRRIESGRTNPTMKTLLRISKALDVEVKELLGDSK